MILHHLPQTVKNNASKAEAPVRGIHSIVNLLRHHYSVSGSWVSTLIIAIIATLITAVAVLACRSRQERDGQFFGAVSASLNPAWIASLSAILRDESPARISAPGTRSGRSSNFPALARVSGPDRAAA